MEVKSPDKAPNIILVGDIVKVKWSPAHGGSVKHYLIQKVDNKVYLKSFNGYDTCLKHFNTVEDLLKELDIQRNNEVIEEYQIFSTVEYELQVVRKERS